LSDYRVEAPFLRKSEKLLNEFIEKSYFALWFILKTMLGARSTNFSLVDSRHSAGASSTFLSEPWAAKDRIVKPATITETTTINPSNANANRLDVRIVISLSPRNYPIWMLVLPFGFFGVFLS
jgi:hypothetical protein